MMISPEQPKANGPRRLAVAALVLVLVTLGLYWPVRHHGFVDFDDYSYVAANLHVMYGLSWDNVVWAFTQSHSANWHPVTWISHMVDVQLFGLNAGPHHLVSVCIHALNGALLFFLLHRWTGAFWRAAFVAAFFAWHPLRVESVAWVAERKDVLSMFFFLLTLLAYGEYVRRPGRGFYFASLGAFLLGLMSKSMLVTTPCVLLLLDFWPFGRLQKQEDGRLNWRQLVREKIPFFALALGCSLIALRTQGQDGAIIGSDTLPLDTRFLNALVTVVRYLGKLAWPVDLSVFYPYQQWPVWKPMVAALLIVAISGGAFYWWRIRPWLFTGWFWFLGTLVPVIGLVQVGQQSMADRYTYLPSIGVAIVLAWLAGECVQKWPRARPAALAGGLAVVVALAAVTQSLVPVWQDSVSLFGHAVAVKPNNPLALLNLGFALKKRGNVREAKEYFLRALQVAPDQEVVHYNLGVVYLQEGDLEKASRHFAEALRLYPGRPETYSHLADLRFREGKVDAAIALFEQALKLNPQDGKTQHNFGVVLARMGRVEEAIVHYTEALRFLPEAAETHNALALALAGTGRLGPAEQHFREAMRSPKKAVEASRGLGAVLALQGRFAEAEPLARRCLESNPESALYQMDYGRVLIGLHRQGEAMAHLRTALRLRPDWFQAQERLAWVLATAPDGQLRDGAEAVRLAERAVQSTNRQMLDALDTLGAAYAEAGRFGDAVKAAEEALKLAAKANAPEVTGKITAHAEAYRQQKPWRDGP